MTRRHAPPGGPPPPPPTEPGHGADAPDRTVAVASHLALGSVPTIAGPDQAWRPSPLDATGERAVASELTRRLASAAPAPGPADHDRTAHWVASPQAHAAPHPPLAGPQPPAYPPYPGAPPPSGPGGRAAHGGPASSADGSGRFALPAAPKVPARESAPLSGWVVPYVLFCLVLALVGAFVLFSQARVLGHF